MFSFCLRGEFGELCCERRCSSLGNHSVTFSLLNHLFHMDVFWLRFLPSSTDWWCKKNLENVRQFEYRGSNIFRIQRRHRLQHLATSHQVCSHRVGGFHGPKRALWAMYTTGVYLCACVTYSKHVNLPKFYPYLIKFYGWIPCPWSRRRWWSSFTIFW